MESPENHAEVFRLDFPSGGALVKFVGERRDQGCTFGHMMSQDWWMVSLREESIGDMVF